MCSFEFLLRGLRARRWSFLNRYLLTLIIQMVKTDNSLDLYVSKSEVKCLFHLPTTSSFITWFLFGILRSNGRMDRKWSVAFEASRWSNIHIHQSVKLAKSPTIIFWTKFFFNEIRWTVYCLNLIKSFVFASIFRQSLIKQMTTTTKRQSL